MSNESVDYHIKVKPWVDFVDTHMDNRPYIMMDPADDYDSMELGNDDFKIFNATFRLKPDQSTIVSFNILSYGVSGGIGEYKLSDLLSEPVNSGGSPKTTIIVNTPDQINHVILEFPEKLRDTLQVPRWHRMARLNTRAIKAANNYNNHDLMARGIDPVGRNYVAEFVYTVPEWGLNRPDDLAKYLDEFVIQVHCFEISLMQDIDVRKQ